MPSHTVYSQSNLVLVRHLGQGAFGTADLWRKKKAAKGDDEYVVSKSALRNVEISIGFEYSILRELDHPNIVAALAYVRDTMYLEYAGDMELKHLVGTNQLQDKHIHPIYSQLADAVEYMRRKHVVHRDIKLENVIVDTKSMHVKLLDFGLATTNVWSKTKCGSPRYAAPEVLAKDVYETGPVDLWSLGVLLYVMIFRTYPFKMATMRDRRFVEYATSKSDFMDAVIAERYYQAGKWANHSMLTILDGLLQIKPRARKMLKPDMKSSSFSSVIDMS